MSSLTSLQGRIPDEKVREQLERILASKAFRHVDRLVRFLTFIVREALAGQSESLKEFLIGMEVFGKADSFDPRTDPIVRVQARRLRARLTRYYEEEGRADEIRIELPRGGYAPVFQRLEVPAPSHPPATIPVSRNVIAVLPIEDYSPRGDLDFFCKSLSQEIITTLTRVEMLRVVADPQNTPEPVESLNHGMRISGTVRKSGNTLRVSVNLVDAASGYYLWSEAFDVKTAGGFAAQEQVARAVLEKVKSALIGGKADKARRTENIDAYNLCLQGRYQWNQRTEEGLRKAVELFEKAIAEDPQYAEAYAGLADAYGLLAHYSVTTPAEVLGKSASNAAWAVMLEEDSAEAHTSLAHVKATQDWDWLGADAEFQRAISLNPNYPTAHHWYAMSCLAPMGKLDQALQQVLLAHTLDPISSIIMRDIAMVHFYRRDFESALEQCDRTLEQNPHFSACYWFLGLVQEQRADFDESAAALQRAIQLSPYSPRMRAGLGRTLALSGKKDEALKVLHYLEELAKSRYVSPFDIASLHFALGRNEPGFEWLTTAFRDRSFDLISIQVDPRFDALRNHPRFVSLSAQLGLP